MHLRKSCGQSKIFVCVGVDSVCSVSCSILCNVSLGGIVGESLAEDGVLTGLGVWKGMMGGRKGIGGVACTDMHTHFPGWLYNSIH